MAKPATRMNEPGIQSAFFTSDPAFFYNQINQKLPASYLRTTEKLANPKKPTSPAKRKAANAKSKVKVSGKKVAGKKPSTSGKKDVKSELQKPKVLATVKQKAKTAKQKAKSIQASREKKAGAAPKLELKKPKKSKASGKGSKSKADSKKLETRVQKGKAVPVQVLKAAASKSKKSTVASKLIVMSTKKTSRKQIKEEGQISKFASWLQKLDSPHDPSERKKLKSAYKRPEPKEIEDIPKKEKPAKQKKKSVRKSKNIDTSIKLSEDIISETLADLLAKQGHTDAAREMYEKLSLINPKKSGLFASKIENLLK